MGHQDVSGEAAGVDAGYAPGGAPQRGRPRDAELDQRIVAAGRHIYLHRGWSGFNLDVVAKAANVSKDAIYRRYRSREQLLAASLVTPAGPPEGLALDSDLRAMLIQLASQNLNRWLDPEGFLFLRVFVESASNPELAHAYHQQVAIAHVRFLRHEVRAAIADGRLTAIDSPTAFIDGLLGGLLMHVIATPPELREQMRAKADQFIVDHVDLLLRGAGYTPR